VVGEHLTAWDDDPDEVHEEKVAPEIVGFRPTICQVLVVMVEHAGGIVENIAINLAKGHNCLQWIS